jgi:GntR family transcriptional regulator
MIERDSPIPLYYQLKQLLSQRIDSGEWQPGDMLPTEMEIQTQYALSRITVRRSLKELELEGKISRFRGRGTFVSLPKISHSPDPHFGLTDVLRQQGVEPEWRVLSAEWIPARPEVAELLQLSAGTAVHCLRRLRLVSDEPIGYHIAHAVPKVATVVSENRLDQGGSLDYLQGFKPLSGSYATRTLEAIPAPEEVATWLAIEVGSPLLSIRRRVIGRDGVPIEQLHAVYRGDRLQYHVRPRQES